MSNDKCCGNCKHFKDEDVNGFGLCSKDGVITRCNTSCSDYSSNFNGWTEITPDNVEGLYYVELCRLMIATLDSHGDPQYAKYDGMSTTLDAMATIGGCYSFVLPELKIE